jgi:hypothetical protein
LTQLCDWSVDCGEIGSSNERGELLPLRFLLGSVGSLMRR